MSLRRFSIALVLIGLFAALPAWACGGFFCSTQPIDQSAERILYIQQGGKITVHVQISYSGEDAQFSWLLPVQKVPTLGIGSDTVFQVLEQTTAPQFSLEWLQKDGCFGGWECAEDAAGGPPNSGGTGGGKGVTILDQQNVGPYATTTLTGDSADSVLKWLNDNGYQQPPATKALIEQYLKQKFVFLALKLQKDKSAGDLQPIVLTMDEPSPCLPLRLTQLAAKPDMPIVAWVLGDARAIPKNFMHVEINEAVVDWLQPGSNYKSVVSKAVDLASGHAFTTEYAQKLGPQAQGETYPQVVTDFTGRFANPQWKPADLAKVATPGAFLQAMLQQGLPRTTQMQNLIRKYIPKPKQFDKISDQEFYGCVQNGDTTSSPCKEYLGALAGLKFDAANFAKDIADLVVAPLTDAQGQFTTGRALTRLYTTVSPVEMTKDPVFAFNATLPNVSPVHKAKAEPICEPGKQQASKVKLTFADGHVLTVDAPAGGGGCFGFGGAVAFGQGGEGKVNADGGQAAKKVQVLDETGPALDVQPGPTADLVDAQLNLAVVGKPSLSADFLKQLPVVTWDPYHVGPVVLGTDAGSTGGDATGTPTAGTSAKSSGCTAAPVSRGPWTAWLAGLLVGGVLLRRRRTSRTAGVSF
jgi:hypothetical protein